MADIDKLQMSLINFKSYLSLPPIESLKLPPLVVLTGRNGSGKTHLLKGISDGLINLYPFGKPLNDERGAPLAALSAKLYSFADLRGRFGSEANAKPGITSSQLIGNFSSELCKALEDPSVAAKAVASGISRDLLDNARDSSSLMRLIEATDDNEGSGSHDLKRLLDILEPHLRARLRYTKELQQVSSRTSKPLAALNQSDIVQAYPHGVLSKGLFELPVKALFDSYRKALQDQATERLAAEYGEENANVLTKDEFDRIQGPLPWDVINNAFKSAGLDFEVEKPPLVGHDDYSVTLRKRSNGIKVPVGGLSSGEGVILALALAAVETIDPRKRSAEDARPQVIMLDEVDATLHPSMIKSFLDMLTKTLVAELGLRVVLATHSPTTVALASEESIYTISAGEAGPVKQSRSEAMKVLCAGIPTLSVNFESRRQVFTEGWNDARVLAQVYSVVAQRITTDCSLTFIPVGSRKNRDESGGGCDRVRLITNNLAGGGNATVLGLVDWDGKHESSDRVHVLAEGVRDGLENCVLDPLLIAAQVVLSFPEDYKVIGLDDRVTSSQLREMPIDTLQRLSTKVCNVLGLSDGNLEPQKYLEGLVVNVPIAFLHCDDHDLEERLLNKFPKFRKFSNDGGLLHLFAQSSMPECPCFIPSVFVDTFTKLVRVAF